MWSSCRLFFQHFLRMSSSCRLAPRSSEKSADFWREASWGTGSPLLLCFLDSPWLLTAQLWCVCGCGSLSLSYWSLLSCLSVQSNAHLREVFRKFGEVLTIISLNFFLCLSPSSPSSTPVGEWWYTRWCPTSHWGAVCFPPPFTFSCTDWTFAVDLSARLLGLCSACCTKLSLISTEF